MLQKIIRVGNSLGIVLPKQFVNEAKFHAGDEVRVDTNPQMKAVYVRPAKTVDAPGLTPEFKEWLDEIGEKEAEIIKALAKA